MASMAAFSGISDYASRRGWLFSDWLGRAGPRHFCTRPRYRIHDPDAAASHIYTFPRTRVPLRPVDDTGWPPVAGPWPRCYENVVADSALCLAVDVGGMEA